MTNTETERTLNRASRELAKAIIKIEKIDSELARILRNKMAAEIQNYREVKRMDRREVEAETKMLAAVE